MSVLKVEDVIELIFTTKNPETGSLPPKKIAWVIFKNDTICLIPLSNEIAEDADFKQLADFAYQELQALGISRAGSPSGDFSVSRVPWYEDEYVYMTTYDSRYIVSILSYEEEMEHLIVGMTGRGGRNLDAEEPKISLIRDFEGNIQRP